MVSFNVILEIFSSERFFLNKFSSSDLLELFYIVEKPSIEIENKVDGYVLNQLVYNRGWKFFHDFAFYYKSNYDNNVDLSNCVREEKVVSSNSSFEISYFNLKNNNFLSIKKALSDMFSEIFDEFNYYSLDNCLINLDNESINYEYIIHAKLEPNV